jgi:two-component system cell cycle response regulator
MNNTRTSRYKVLVVDDSPVYRKLIEQILCGEGYQLLLAQDGKEALQLYRDESPSIVVTDWLMPDISGIELCREIRKDHSRPYVYTILMTAKSEKDNVVQGLKAGADDYLVKPFHHGEMLARIGVGRRITELNQELACKSKELEEAALTDHLTGLPNRRAIEDWASRQLQGAARHGFPFWLVLCDIDSFKEINDTFGHDAGDVILQSFANLLKKNVRRSDFCGRLGGDEFLLVITHVDAEGIEIVGNRFREALAALSFPLGGKSIKVSTSVGVAGCRGRGMHDFRVLLRRADKMLYDAKHSGRNCVMVSPVESAPDFPVASVDKKAGDSATV